MASDAVANFGDLLRRARHAAGLSQEELAERAGLSVRGISDLERGIARRPRKDTLDMLAAALGLSDDERRDWELARRQLAGSETLARKTNDADTNQPAGNLPPRLTTFIGREREADELRALLDRPEIRLVTVTGPGGIGKTSLAIHVATEVAATFRDGTHFVSLAPIRDPALVASAMATVLGLQDRGVRGPEETLATYLSRKRALLMLDNFEQVIDAAPLISEILGRCPQLKVLVTSRASLNVGGEHEYPVQPLDVPDPERRLPAGDLAQLPAVALFISRARTVLPDFQPSDTQAQAIVTICHRLDGLPLAIELAAARVRVLPPEAMLTRMERRLSLLTGGPRDMPARLRTMRDAIAWSVDLLNQDEQALFRQLAVFSGACTIVAAEDVCRSNLDILDGLESLVDKNLLRRTINTRGPAHEPRFEMLETIREFGLEQLDAQGDFQDVRDRHAGYVTTLAQEAGVYLDTDRQREWSDRIEAELSNVRAALSWLYEHGDIERGLRLVGSLWIFWYVRGYLSEGLAWADRFLGLPDASLPTIDRAQALAAAGWMAVWKGDYSRATRRCEEALAIFREHGDLRAIPGVLTTLGLSARFSGDISGAAAFWEQSLSLAREVGDIQNLTRSLGNLAGQARRRGDTARASEMYQEALEVAMSNGHTGIAAWILSNLALLSQDVGEPDRAAALYRESLMIYRELGGVISSSPESLEGLAVVAHAQGSHRRAACLIAAATAIREQTGIAIQPVQTEPVVAATLQALGDRDFRAAWHVGSTMTLDDAVAFALEPIVADVSPASDRRSFPDNLTVREVEVLRLIAAGHSNRQIADILFLSPRTIERHTANVYLKIDVHTKAEATAYAQRQQLV